MRRKETLHDLENRKKRVSAESYDVQVRSGNNRGSRDDCWNFQQSGVKLSRR